MASTIRLFKLFGIRISIDYTWFIIFALFAWSLGSGYYPEKLPGLSVEEYYALGALSSLLLFVCVLLHELAHSVTSNRLGLEIKEITLFIFGGVAKLTREPDNAMVEFKVAIAGPLMSSFLAVMFTLLEKIVEARFDIPVLVSLLGFLAMINMVLLIFNMIPGFPLDGGRALRALWWAKTGNIRRATQVTSQIGKLFAMTLMFLGFLNMLSGQVIQGMWAFLIGLFLQNAADSGYRQLITKMALEGVRVSDIMSEHVVTVPDDIRLSDVIDKYFFHYHFVSFPVISAPGGKVVGLLTINDFRKIERDKWNVTMTREVMDKLTPESVLHPNDMVQHALSKMLGEKIGRYVVLDAEDRLIGILSRRDIMKTMEIKKTLGG